VLQIRPSLFSLAVIIASIFVTQHEASANVFISFDEWGKGFICGDAGFITTPLIPPCGVGPQPGVGSFLRLPSGFMADPTSGGGANVLTYLLPMPINFGTLDIGVLDAPSADGDTDLIRVLGDRILIYSKQGLPAMVDCSKNPITDPNNPNLPTGCDGLADVPTIPSSMEAFTVTEIGQTTGPAFGFVDFMLGGANGLDFVSDEGSDPCAAVPCAPPTDNPFRDITGLDAMPGQVTLRYGPNFNPINTPVPEPRFTGLFLAGAVLLAAYHWLRHRATTRASHIRHRAEN
jgi:hypothetical protein